MLCNKGLDVQQLTSDQAFIFLISLDKQHISQLLYSTIY